MPPVYLIGGAPCAGKSTVAKALAEELGQSWVSIDDLRSEIQTGPGEKRHHYPWIFSNATISAEAYWRSHRPEDVIQLEIHQAREIWPMLRQTIDDKKYGVVEGVSILPENIPMLPPKGTRVVFLIDSDRKRVERTIHTRGLWAEAETYADWIKPLELEWVMMHNKWFQKECQKYGLPCIDAGDRATLLPRVKTALGLV